MTRSPYLQLLCLLPAAVEDYVRRFTSSVCTRRQSPARPLLWAMAIHYICTYTLHRSYAASAAGPSSAALL